MSVQLFKAELCANTKVLAGEQFYGDILSEGTCKSPETSKLSLRWEAGILALQSISATDSLKHFGHGT